MSTTEPLQEQNTAAHHEPAHYGEDFIPVAAPVIGPREIQLVTEAVTSGWVSSIGPFIDQFENAFASYIGVRNAIAVSNGTVGLHLVLHGLGIGPGDEVILPDLTFVATAHAVLQVGATPVFVDIDPETLCIDPELVEAAVTEQTRAIIPVHLFGHPVAMDRLARVAEQHGLRIIEDAAEAHGAQFAGCKVGAIGDAGIFSFYGNKVVTTGEGGIITTNDDNLADRFRFLKDHGMIQGRRYYHTELAFNYRMTNIQAALGLAQLERIEEFVERKRAIARLYREELSGFDFLRLSSERPGCRSVFWMVNAILDTTAPDCTRVREYLRERGIDTRPFFVPMSQLPHLRRFRCVGSEGNACPISADLSQRAFSLPSGAGLTENQVKRCAFVLKEALHTL